MAADGSVRHHAGSTSQATTTSRVDQSHGGVRNEEASGAIGRHQEGPHREYRAVKLRRHLLILIV